ncbi:MAG: DUF1385 domain-containing protein [Actinobacteria bacterium]|nr:DUF1385 domain-containing protein [Actinomycetota bacterium]
MASEPTRYLGGQAVMEGVMMRGTDSWAVAVRRPDGEIDVTVHDAPRWANRYQKIPLVRGVATLWESLSIGYRALNWSAQVAMEEEEDQPSEAATRMTMVIAMTIFAAVFMLTPGIISKSLGSFTDSTLRFNVVEGLIRLTMFLGYIIAIGLIPDIRRVFQYHGAEHKAIAAYENGDPLTVEAAQRYSTEHIRCGTNFLLTVMVISIASHALFGNPGWALLIASRVLGIPLVAGLSYEVIRAAANHADRPWVRFLMLPGLSLQRLTTREPDDDQVAVALVSVEAVLTAQQAESVAQRATSPDLVWRPALGS